AFDNTTSGAVTLTNAGGVTIANVAGSGASSNSGTTTSLTANGGPLTFAINVTSTGTLTATTTENASEAGNPPEDDLTVNNGAPVDSRGGDVVLTAGASLTVQSGGPVQPDTGSISLTAGMGDTDSDATMTLNGTLNSTTGLTITSTGDVCIGA